MMTMVWKSRVVKSGGGSWGVALAPKTMQTKHKVFLANAGVSVVITFAVI